MAVHPFRWASVVLRRASSGGHRPRRIAIAIGIAATLATLSGCTGALLSGVYLLEPARTTYFTERFEWWNDWQWHYSSEEAFAPERFQIAGGRFVANDWRQFAITNERFPGSLEVWLDWEVWYPDDTLTPDLLTNNDQFDIRIVLDTSGTQGHAPSGPGVELKLFGTPTNPVDRLTIREDVATSTVVAAQEVPSTGVSRGSLRATFSLERDPPLITATLFSAEAPLDIPVLEASLEATTLWPDNVPVMLEASGRLDALPAPRVLDTAHVMPLVEGP